MASRRSNCELSETQISSSCSTESSGPSLLEKLQCPKPSKLARKRKVQQNSSPKGKRRACGHGTFDPKSVTPAQRVKEFPEESLCVLNKNFFCILVCFTAGLQLLQRLLLYSHLQLQRNGFFQFSTDHLMTLRIVLFRIW